MKSLNPLIKSGMEKMKDTVTRLVSGSVEEKQAITLEVDPYSLDVLKQVAEQKRISVHNVAKLALEQFVENNSQNKTKPKVTLEQKEKNPLFYLNGMTKSLKS